jgi:hypothetical protein
MNIRSVMLFASALATSVGFLAAPAVALDLSVSAFGQSKVELPPPVRVQTGSKNGMSWIASSLIIGQTPTSDVLPPTNTIGGGDPIYRPSANKSGVVALIMEFTGGGASICSGSLLGDGMSIATAGHCVSGGFGTVNPLRTTAYFFAGDPDSRTPFQPVGTAIEVSRYFVNPGYTGEVIDQNDIAILRLKAGAPSSAERYDLFTPLSLTGTGFNVAGYGTRSTVGGAAGNTAPAGARTGFLREGDNIYDYAFGNSLFNGFFTDVIAGENFFGTADIQFSYVSDFDNGLAAQDQANRIAVALGAGTVFANVGVGAREVGIAGGDSGGPGFVNGQLASINSYGLTFGAGFGDFGGGLNAGFGEFSGYVPVYIHANFISNAMAVPEPTSWAMLIAGFGLIGGSMRRRRMAVIAA